LTEGVSLVHNVPVDPKGEIGVIALARIGDFALAESSLNAMQVEFPQGTIWNDFRGPEVRAEIALSSHRPKDAIAALERARPLEGRDPIITMLRGDAYLAAGEPALAEASYRKVVDRTEQNPETGEIPLSWLGLGRARAAEDKRPAAIEAYRRFLTLWEHADPDAKFLIEAKNELKALEA
jgi:predicted Zn-dependent protease